MTDQLNSTKHRRKPLTALSLSMIEPGLGQIYCGRLAKGLIFMVLGLAPLLVLQGLLLATNLLLPAIIAALTAMILIQLVSMIDAWYLAKHTRHDYQPKEYNRCYVYLLLMLISTGGGIGSAFYIKANVANAFKIASNSMAPTVMQGDRVLTNKLVYRTRDPKIGDVIVFANPDDRRVTYIKRVVAVAGDTVQITDGVLYINGTAVQTTKAGPIEVEIEGKMITGNEFIETNGASQYSIFLADEPADICKKDFDLITIPKNHCFVMGDNRNISHDSRHFGSIPLIAVKGRVELTYFSANRWQKKAD
ncbi:MAG: signal peptidase I [Anaerohalosphaera sp.]|nr:signal peptidase I [Anaerohalosphaera sp.]